MSTQSSDDSKRSPAKQLGTHGPKYSSIQHKETAAMKTEKKYALGYGKPPKHTQFQKGTSGNKKGRPKGARNFATMFHKELYQRIPISENSQHRTITKVEAAIKQLINKAATGDPKAIQAVMNILKEGGEMKLPNMAQHPAVTRFTLRVFEKDRVTGERKLVKTSSHEQGSE